jgi:hypothetical protein
VRSERKDMRCDSSIRGIYLFTVEDNPHAQNQTPPILSFSYKNWSQFSAADSQLHSPRPLFLSSPISFAADLLCIRVSNFVAACVGYQSVVRSSSAVLFIFCWCEMPKSFTSAVCESSLQRYKDSEGYEAPVVT